MVIAFRSDSGVHRACLCNGPARRDIFTICAGPTTLVRAGLEMTFFDLCQSASSDFVGTFFFCQSTTFFLIFEGSEAGNGLLHLKVLATFQP